MKIIYLVTGIAYGGAELQVIRLASRMTENGNEVFYISLMKSVSKELVSELEKNKVTYISLGMERGKPSIKAYFNFIKIANKINPDVIHAHMVHANYLLRAASPFIKRSIKLNTVHGEEEYLGKRPLIYRITDGFVKYTICCSIALQNQALRKNAISKKRCLMIYNGLDISKYDYNESLRSKFRTSLNISDDTFVWITVGRLATVKNQLYLLKEFNKLCYERKDCCLVLIGDGDERDRLETYVKENNLRDRVYFMGLQKNVEELLCMADAFILSSVHEGLPLSLQEAASIGLPLVATNVGGCNEVIEEGTNGYLCNSNEENALAGAMRKLMNLPPSGFQMMKNASRQITLDKFDMNSIIKKWETLYECKKNTRAM